MYFRMRPDWKKWGLAALLTAGMIGWMFGQAGARPLRFNQIPNGGINRCSNCHFNPMGGGGRNAFGQTIEKSFLVPPATPANATIDLFTVNWGPDLAKLDSDGDGVTNGQELGDPDGAWRSGQPAPGNPRNVSLPGDQQSRSGDLSFVAVANVQVQREDVPAPLMLFTASLDGAQENPPVTTTGRGTGAFWLDGAGLHYQVTISGLSGAISASHFHIAARGTNGGVVRATPFVGSTSSGVWGFNDTAQPLTPTLLRELLAGRAYFNVHTQANPGGEIRGQVDIASGLGFQASLDGAQENPPVTTGGRGTGAFWLDGTGLRYRVTVDGLSGPISASHFHNGPRGVNAGVVRAAPFEGSTASGVWGFDDTTQPLTSALLSDLLRGRIYFNVHTQANPGGEIRGQVDIASGLGFQASLDGSQENPPVTTGGRGTGAFWLDGTGLRYQVTISGLSGAISASHFHIAARGTNGGVVRATPFVGSTSSGVWGFNDATQPLTLTLLRDLLSGRTYFNVHTQANPGGEIRGQVDIASGLGFQASLDGAQENPPVTTTGRGTGTFWLDGTGLRYQVTIDGLSGAIRGSHFHNGPRGVNAGVVRTAPFEGSTASGVWGFDDTAQPLTLALLGDLLAGRAYFNVHTAANPGGEIRGQVLQPRLGLLGLTVDFDRSTAGQRPFSRLVQSTPTTTARFGFSYRGTTDANGRATVNIVVQQEPAYRRVGASGYYWARLTDPTTGAVLGLWSSIPLRGGRVTELLLKVGGQAAITGPFFGTPLAATKPVAALPTVTTLSGAEPLAPAVSFGAAEMKAEGAVDLPVQIGGRLFGGDLTLAYDPALLAFRSARIGTTEVAVTSIGPGQVLLSFDGLTPANQGDMVLSFDRRAGDRMGDLKLSGVLFDQEFMPIGDVAAEALLNGAAPKDYALFQNYPNPFNPATTIHYTLPEAGRVRLTVYNALGQQVARLVDLRQEAGAYSVTWDARDFASGVYYYRLEAGSFREVRKLVLLK